MRRKSELTAIMKREGWTRRGNELWTDQLFISLLFVNCTSFSRQLILSFVPHLSLSSVNVYYFSTLSHSQYTHSVVCLWQATVRFRLNFAFNVDAKRQIWLTTVIFRLCYFPLQAQWQFLQLYLQWFLWLIELINYGTLLNFTLNLFQCYAP